MFDDLNFVVFSSLTKFLVNIKFFVILLFFHDIKTLIHQIIITIMCALNFKSIKKKNINAPFSGFYFVSKLVNP